MTFDIFILPKRVIREMEDNNTYRCVWTCTTYICTEEILWKAVLREKAVFKNTKRLFRLPNIMKNSTNSLHQNRFCAEFESDSASAMASLRSAMALETQSTVRWPP